MKIESADIFVDIIDNYGDMGFVLEFMYLSGLGVHFRIITDHPSKLKEFLRNSSNVNMDTYEILEKKGYDYSFSSPLIIITLHANVDLGAFPEGKHILRINYLSYDPWYRKIHEQEHILSRPGKPILELAYSPLSGTGGVWHYEKSSLSRQDWLKKNGLPKNLVEKLWIPIFCYPETLKHFDISTIPENVALFFIGQTEVNLRHLLPGFTDHLTNSLSDQFTVLPWLSRDDFWNLIDLSDISVLRGEISSLRGLMSEKPYMWDMYKELGGWNQDESLGFLEFIEADEIYRDIHSRINTHMTWTIEDILSGKDHWKNISTEKVPDFSQTLKNTIDSFGFSL